jgi:hypothetical protein
MNSTIISEETKRELKELLQIIEDKKEIIKNSNDYWIECGMTFNLYDDGIIEKSKRKIKKYNKRIYEIIKTL